MKNPYKISAIICAKNEERSISEMIEGTKRYVDEILVVDGHSSDGTVELAQRLGARVVLDNRKGKGDAVRVGIKNAKGDILVFIDADGSHDPADIPRLVQLIQEDKADLVIGSRMKGGSDELHGDVSKFIRMWGSDIITIGINLRFKQNITDSQNGFRAIRANCARALNLQENITTIEQEMLIKSLHHNFKVAEVPAHEYARKFGTSTINVKKVAFRYVYSWLKYLIFKKLTFKP